MKNRIKKVFGKMPSGLIDKIARIGKIATIPRRRVVVVENATADFVYFILKGKFQVFRTIEGEEKTLAILSAGDIFGEMSMEPPLKRSASVRAIEKSSVIKVEISEFKKFAKKNIQLSNFLIQVLIRRLRRTDKFVEVLSYDSVKKRIQQILLLFADIDEDIGKSKRKVRLNIMQTEIAAMLVTAREVVNRTLRILRDRKLVRVAKGYIEIPSVKKLREFSFN